MHARNDFESRNFLIPMFFFEQGPGNDTNHLAAGLHATFCDNPHQTNVAATINQLNAFPGE